MHRRGFCAVIASAAVAGCNGPLTQTRGTVILENYSTKAVTFTIGVESAQNPDTEETPRFRNEYQAPPEQDVILPEILDERKYRISVLVSEATDSGSENTLAQARKKYRPTQANKKIYIRYGLEDSKNIEFKKDS